MIVFTHHWIILTVEVSYLKHKFRVTHQEHETLQLQLMVMSGYCFLAPFSETNQINIFSQDILHGYFTNGSHSSVDSFHFFFSTHCIYHDRIECWLEKYFHERFPVNINVLLSPMFDIIL